MADVEIILKERNRLDPARSSQWRISLPDDIPVGMLLGELVPRLGLPSRQSDGSELKYNLHHEKSGKQLSANTTLHDAGVSFNDTCFLMVEQELSSPPIQAAPQVRRQQLPSKPASQPRVAEQGTSDSDTWDSVFEAGLFLVYVIPAALIGAFGGAAILNSAIVGGVIGIVLGIVIWFIREIS